MNSYSLKKTAVKALAAVVALSNSDRFGRLRFRASR